MQGEHTIIGKIPRERLNQIASRKLSALGIPVRLGADRETIEGDLAFSGRVMHPATGQPIARARFVVEGHDHLRFLDPPLAALGSVSFGEHARADALEQAIATAIVRRGVALQDVAARMRALRLETGMDPDRFAARAVVKTATHAFEILGGLDGVRVARVAPVGGMPFDVPADFPPLELSDFETRTDLELFLTDAASRMRAPDAPRPPAAARGAALEATPAPRNALTLAALAQVFGSDAILAPNAMVELIQEFQYGGTRYRFVAAREMGTAFRGRLIGPGGDVWTEKFELADFPGTRKVVASALGASDEAEAGPGVEAALSTRLPHLLQPQPGQVWVMSVVVEDAGPSEVRYVGTDMDGRPYGAARVLKRAEFEAVFTQEQGAWRLLIQIDQVQEGNVIYRQLDPGRQPMGAPRKMSAAILVANFVPEASAH
jgi:hypothetical protein